MANGQEFAMPISLRADFDALAVRAAARKSKDGAQARRLLALGAIYEGSSRTEEARLGGVTLQIVRDWVVKFNAAGPDGLIDRKAPGEAAAPERDAPRRAGRGDRAGADTGRSWSSSLADHRSGIDAVGRLLAIGIAADAEPRVARARLPQIVDSAQAPRPGSRGDRSLQKGGFAAALDKVRASLPRGTSDTSAHA